MEKSRRKFLRNSFLVALGTFFFPSTITRLKADSNIELNYKPEPLTWDNSQISLAWIGHATVLINFYGKWIITDPALMERIGLYFLGSSIGPTRLTPPALTVDEIPKPDIILLSHAHMDHMDYPTLSSFADKYPNEIDVITAYLTKDVIEDLPWKSISVIDWEESVTVQGIEFNAHEVEHFGWRFPWEKDRSRGYKTDGRSYNAYLIKYKGSKILFGGDTRYTTKLQKLKDENIDIAIMPIGAYNPWKRAHCNPEEALQMANEMNAKHLIPIHCKTFKQSSEPFNEPIEWLNRSAPNYAVNLGLDEIGQTFTFKS